MGLIARELEAAGVPTLSMSSALDITQAVKPPRAAFLDFPLGHTTGKPHEPELQRAILEQALEAFTSLTTPGTVKMLPFRWSDDDGWKRDFMTGSDDRIPRHSTPQFQTEDDRLRADESDPDRESCPVCRVTV